MASSMIDVPADVQATYSPPETTKTSNVSNPIAPKDIASSVSTIPKVQLLVKGHMKDIESSSNEVRKFWIKIYGSARKCQETQNKCLDSIRSLELEERSREGFEWNVRNFLNGTMTGIKEVRKDFKEQTKELENINAVIRKANKKAARPESLGLVFPSPYVKPLLNRPADDLVIETNPALLLSLLESNRNAYRLQRYRYEFYESDSYDRNEEDSITQMLTLIDDMRRMDKEVQEQFKKDDTSRKAWQALERERMELYEEHEELDKQEQDKYEMDDDGKAALVVERRKLEEKTKRWKDLMEKDYSYVEDIDEPLREFKEFASIYIPEQGDNPDPGDDEFEPSEPEYINTSVLPRGKMHDVQTGDEIHVEERGKEALGGSARGPVPPEIAAIYDQMSGMDGPLQVAVLSIKRNKDGIEITDQGACAELSRLHNLIYEYCDKNDIPREKYTIGMNHIAAFADMIMNAGIVYDQIRKDTTNLATQQQYLQLREVAEFSMKQYDFPPSFLDSLVPPPETIEQLIREEQAKAKAPVQPEVPVEPRVPVKPKAPVVPKASVVPKAPIKPQVNGQQSNSTNPAQRAHELDAAIAAATAIPIEDTDDQCAPTVQSPPGLIIENKIVKKVASFREVGRTRYALLKWQGTNPKFPNLFQHELVPEGQVGDKIDEFISSGGKEMVVSGKPSKAKRWFEAQITGIAPVRRFPGKKYKIEAMTYIFVKFPGEPVQRYTQSDLKSRFGYEAVKHKANKFLKMSGQKPSVPPTRRVFVDELKRNTRTRSHNVEEDEEGSSIDIDQDSSEEDEDEDEGNVSDLIDDELEEDEEITRRRNEILDAKKRALEMARAELDAKYKVALNALDKKGKKKAR